MQQEESSSPFYFHSHENQLCALHHFRFAFAFVGALISEPKERGLRGDYNLSCKLYALPLLNMYCRKTAGGASNCLFNIPHCLFLVCVVFNPSVCVQNPCWYSLISSGTCLRCKNHSQNNYITTHKDCRGAEVPVYTEGFESDEIKFALTWGVCVWVVCFSVSSWSVRSWPVKRRRCRDTTSWWDLLWRSVHFPHSEAGVSSRKMLFSLLAPRVLLLNFHLSKG